MKRKAEKILQAWLEDSNFKHLYMTGLRGCGKTTLVLDFAARSFKDDYLYLNFETSYDLRAYFENTEFNDLAEALKTFSGQPEGIPAGSCIILDELHCCSSAPQVMEKATQIKDFRIIVIDSENVNINAADSWQKIRLYPLSFDEFLNAILSELS